MKLVGVDVGSTTVKAAVVDEGRVTWQDYQRHNTRQAEKVLEFLGRMEAEAGLTPHAGFKSILCPLDFADPAAKALQLAVSLARENSARLLLLHVVEGWAEDDARDHSHWTVPEYRRFLEKEAKDRLQAAVGPADRSACAVEEVLAAGKPYVEILRLAAERASDLIVMGVHGRSPLDVMLFGSAAQHVVRVADCPVITVRS